ncbi:MAG: phosphotransferase [Candidatus Sabulitectum sp.]|nr:phosphotransferase [Candidatus Sabulitectum sp.]
MEKRITDRFCEHIIEEVAVRYGISRDRLEKLGGFESYMFRYSLNNAGYVLRIAHSLRRSEKLIQAEVEWIRYLASNGVSVADAVLSFRGDLVEGIADGHGDYFLATAFNEVKGKPPRAFGWTPELFTDYGTLMGQMHRLAKQYTPSDPGIQRPLWSSPDINDDVLINLPDDQPVARERYEEILSRLESLPLDIDSFGLIHFDAHSGNMLVDEKGTIHLFDFDDCNRNWFINDLAIVLFYMVTNVEDPERTAGEFLPSFLHGYSKENSLDFVWLKEIPLFLRMREIDLYAIIHRSFDVNNLTGWCGQFMKGRLEKIENAEPYLDLDFTTLAKYLK